MSYILDALKRADAERSRGAVPGLHARQLPSADNAAPLLLQNRVWLPIVAAGLLGAVGLWAWRTPTPAPSLPAPLAAAPLAAPTAAPAPEPTSATPASIPVSAMPAPLAPTASAQPVATPAPRKSLPPVLPAVAANTQAESPKATPSSTATTAALAKTLPSASAPAPQTAQASAPPAVASVAPPAAPVVTPLLSELPDTLRSQLPKLAITGTVYAEDPKQRLLLVNNQVLPQGSVLAPDLTLEEIRPRHSVFNFRGTRFRVAH